MACSICTEDAAVMIAVSGNQGMEANLKVKIEKLLPIKVNAETDIICERCFLAINEFDKMYVTCLTKNQSLQDQPDPDKKKRKLDSSNAGKIMKLGEEKTLRGAPYAYEPEDLVNMSMNETESESESEGEGPRKESGLETDFDPDFQLTSLLNHHRIKYGDTGVDMKNLLNDAAENVEKMIITDPFVYNEDQLEEFNEFLNIMQNKSPMIRDIHLRTARASGMFAGVKVKNSRKLEYIKISLEKKGIQFSYSFNQNIHDRYAILSNGRIIFFGRGLDFYKVVPKKKFTEFVCRDCNIFIFEGHIVK